MSFTREKSKSRKSNGRFAGIPHAVMNHSDYLSLPPNAIRLLLELCRQYNGYNNGDLTASWTVMKKRGFKSKSTLNKSLKALLQSNLICKTREGYFQNPGGVCALYSLNWNAVDECKGKNLEIGPTRTPARRVFDLDSLTN